MGRAFPAFFYNQPILFEQEIFLRGKNKVGDKVLMANLFVVETVPIFRH